MQLVQMQIYVAFNVMTSMQYTFHQLHISVQQFESDRGKIMFALGALVISLVLVLH